MILIMKQVKVFWCSNAGDLEEEMNNFLAQPGNTICEIQYRPFGGYGSQFSGMIIYESQTNNDN